MSFAVGVLKPLGGAECGSNPVRTIGGCTSVEIATPSQKFGGDVLSIYDTPFLANSLTFWRSPVGVSGAPLLLTIELAVEPRRRGALADVDGLGELSRWLGCCPA